MGVILGLFSAASFIVGLLIVFSAMSDVHLVSGFILILTGAVFLVGSALYDRIGDLLAGKSVGQ